MTFDRSGATTQPALLGQVIHLAWPVVIEQLLLHLVGLSDTLITGRLLAVDQLAAVTVASYLMWFVASIQVVSSAGATALVARRVGAGRRQDAIEVSHQALLLACGVGLALLGVGLALAPRAVRWMNLDGSAAREAVDYLRVTLMAVPLLAIQTTSIACLRGAGDTKTGLAIMAVVNSLNIALSWAAAVGALGLPRMGLRGVALGTAVAESLGGCLVIAALAAGRGGLAFRLRWFRPRLPILRDLMRIGLPAFGEGLTNAGCQLWFLGLINRLGPTATAAHGVAIRCEAIAFLTVTAFSVAASTLTGLYLGAGQPESARRAALVSWRLGTGVITFLALLILAGAEPLFQLFLGDGQPGVAPLGIPVLRLVALALPALATLTVLGGALRGAGDTRSPWLIVTLGYLLVRIPLTYLLAVERPPLGLPGGLLGAWIAMFADLHVRALLTALWFRAGRWQRLVF
ncbi:MAG: MATE family efflux transporter [Isosphaeraceae bacterium]|jgi:putative MATE family efflux protein|nr:MAG: MATE family efflux transporter [Isosphaeraceae bacterium]